MQTQDIGDLPLVGGATLVNAQIAYETRGTLSPDRDNVVLVLHGYTSGPDSILPGGEPLEGSWADLVGPGKAIDTERYSVICPNALGSAYGSTGPCSIDPATSKPYGSSFPPITVADLVASQRALLDKLGIDRLLAVVGPSFGGLQALQWGVNHSDQLRGLVAASTSIGRPPVNVDGVLAGLSRDPHWNGGDYYERGNLLKTLVEARVRMLDSYGVGKSLAAQYSDPDQCKAVMLERARAWAARFDANSLLVIMKTMASYDLTAEVHKIRARVLYVLSRTDHLFPPSLAVDAMARFKAAGVDAEYFEIDSEQGHSGVSADAALWAPVLARFLSELSA